MRIKNLNFMDILLKYLTNIYPIILENPLKMDALYR